jgi:transposase
MPATNRYPDTLRRRAIDEVLTKGRTIAAVSADLGMNDQTLRNWVNQERRDKGLAPGATSDQLARIKELEKEVAELRRSNEILKEATRFFAKEADRPRTK